MGCYTLEYCRTTTIGRSCVSELSVLPKLQTHVRDTVLARSSRFAFYRFLHIIDRRIPLPREVFLGEIFCCDEFLLEEYLTPSKNLVLVDVGGKVGLWTLRLAKRCKEVHAFEPNPESFSLLERNTRKLKNVNLYPFALGEEIGYKDFFVHKRPGYSSLVIKYADHVKTIRIPVRTLDSFDLGAVDLIKIDTEGYELPVLRGGRKTIGREKPQLYIEIHMPEQKSLILKTLREFGYAYSVYHLRNTFQSIIVTDLEE